MKKSIKSYNIDEELCKKVDELSIKFNKNRSQIIEEAIRLYSDPAIVDEIEKGIQDIKTKIFMKYIEKQSFDKIPVGYYDF